MSRVVLPTATQLVPLPAPPRSLKRRLAPNVITEIVSRYQAGEHTSAFSKEFGISKTGLRELLLAEGIRFRRQPTTSEDVDRAMQLYEGGMTVQEVVELIGYSASTVRRELHQRGVAMRTPGLPSERE